MACMPQRVLASPSAPISLGAPSVSPSLNVTAGEGAALQPKDGPQKSSSDEQSKTGFAPDKKLTGTQEQEEKTAAPGETEKSADGEALTQEEKAQLAKLRARDREVRAHEQAHAAAGGALAGAPSYSYQTGPDGKQYAVGGEVPIRASASSSNPRQAIAQLQQVARAASAPASPSGQDRAVAAQARAQIAELQAQLAQESQAKAQAAMESAAPADDAEQSQTAPAGGLPTLPELPELPAIGNAPAPAQGKSTGHGNAAPDVSPPPVSTITQRVTPSNEDDSSTAGGPIQIAHRHAGPIAAYQQSEGPTKPPQIIGRIVSLNA